MAPAVLLVPPYILSFINKAKFVSSKPMMKPIVELSEWRSTARALCCL